MATDSGKRTILNPGGSKPILDFCDTPEECAKEVQSRFSQHVMFVLQSERVMGEFDAIKTDIENFFKETCEQLCEMENEWVIEKMQNESVCTEINDLASTGASLGMLFVILKDVGIAIPMFQAASFFFYVAAFTYNFLWKRDRRKENKKAIDTVYDKCMSSVRKIVSDYLENNVATSIKKLLDKVTVDRLPEQIEALEEMIQQLMTSRRKLISNRGLLLDLASKIDNMQENVCKMQRDLLTNQLLIEQQKSTKNTN